MDTMGVQHVNGLFMSKLHSSTAQRQDDVVMTKPPSLLWNLAFNLILPTLILTKLSGEEYLGIKPAILIALAFPIIYGSREFINLRKVNFFSALGIVSVSLTGGISLLELDAVYIAIKEAAIPGMLGIAVLLSLKTSQPLIHTFLLNESVMNTAAISQALKDNDA
ncbi:MAG: intracellular septation protein A, partial [Polaribacter sp.]